MPHIVFMIFFIAIIIILSDQALKILIRHNIEEGSHIEVIGDFFRLTHYENNGAAFSSLSGYSAVLIIIPIVVIAAIFIFIIKKKTFSLLGKIALGLVLGGAVGNLIDRVLYGQVTDMFSFSIFPAIFNIADIAVVLGYVIGFVVILLDERNKNNVGGGV